MSTPKLHKNGIQRGTDPWKVVILGMPASCVGVPRFEFLLCSGFHALSGSKWQLEQLESSGLLGDLD